jgi:hypothetical protein
VKSTFDVSPAAATGKLNCSHFGEATTRRILPAFFVGLVLAGCRQEGTSSKEPPATEILGGSSVSSAAGTIQSGSFWMNQGEVAIAFAPAQPGQKDLEFSWVVLVKQDWSPGPGKGQSTTISPVVTSDGTSATSGIKIEINGKSFELIDRFRVQLQDKTLTDEVVEVNGKTQDLKVGRVFLVDLTAQPSTVEQRAVDLSGPPTTVNNNTPSIEAAALRARDKVTQKDEVARKFVGGAK